MTARFKKSMNGASRLAIKAAATPALFSDHQVVQLSVVKWVRKFDLTKNEGTIKLFTEAEANLIMKEADAKQAVVNKLTGFTLN
jgi:hypothetical protein